VPGRADQRSRITQLHLSRVRRTAGGRGSLRVFSSKSYLSFRFPASRLTFLKVALSKMETPLEGAGCIKVLKWPSCPARR